MDGRDGCEHQRDMHCMPSLDLCHNVRTRSARPSAALWRSGCRAASRHGRSRNAPTHTHTDRRTQKEFSESPTPAHHTHLDKSVVRCGDLLGDAAAVRIKHAQVTARADQQRETPHIPYELQCTAVFLSVSALMVYYLHDPPAAFASVSGGVERLGVTPKPAHTHTSTTPKHPVCLMCVDSSL